MQIDMRKIYNFYPVDPPPPVDQLPTGGDIYYECQGCSVIVSSVPRIKSACECGNLSGSAGKITIKDPSNLKVVRGKLK